ncbi:hypothetical protein [Komagataeibacter kakiaceti]|uniref:hypothetical protein n=1 Tax=Komagataeibacter kakiaceti TaxID=943261 RepID=UPI0004706A7C|nr:hypothetical protein [Komagataeibacter kakiaceti]
MKSGARSFCLSGLRWWKKSLTVTDGQPDHSPLARPAELTVYLRTATHIQPRNHIDWGDEYGWHNRHGLCPYLEERRFLMLFEKSFTKNFLLV